jgi:hypothetical protein
MFDTGTFSQGMKMKKIKYLFVLMIVSFISTGCYVAYSSDNTQIIKIYSGSYGYDVAFRIDK